MPGRPLLAAGTIPWDHPSYALSMRVALCQIPVSSDSAVNAGRVREALGQAADQGADLAVFPEATQVRFGSDLRAAAEPLDGPFCSGLAAAAKDTGVALVAGVFEPAPDGRVYNTAVACDGAGELVASYRKLHLFDAFGQRESELVAPGSSPVVCTLGGIRAGLAICYDVRFPELFRSLAAGGSALIVLPGGLGGGAVQGGALGHAGAGARDREHRVGSRGRPGARPGRAAHPGGDRGRAQPAGRPAGCGAGRPRPAPGVTVAEVDAGLVGTVRATLPSLANRRDDVFGAPAAVQES